MQINSTSAANAAELKQFSKQLRSHLETVSADARNILLLSLNASVEAMHATSFIDSFKSYIAKCLLDYNKLIALNLSYDGGTDVAALANHSGIEIFTFTDEEGVRTASSSAETVGSAVPREYMPILSDKTKIVYDNKVSNAANNSMTMKVASARQDKPGIICTGAHYTPPRGEQTIKSFEVVAVEVKKQAGEIFDACETLGALLNDIDAQLDADAIDGLSVKLMQVSNQLTYITNAARIISLLGIRAKIEASGVVNDRLEFDKLLSTHLTTEVKLISWLFTMPGAGNELAMHILEETGLELWIADGNGVTEITNIPTKEVFVFKDEGQTAPYAAILRDPELVVAPAPSLRVIDNRMFKFVGVGRLDKPGIVQVGIPAEYYKKSTSDGFTIVAVEIRTLADGLYSTANDMSDCLSKMKAAL